VTFYARVLRPVFKLYKLWVHKRYLGRFKKRLNIFIVYESTQLLKFLIFSL
jgi:hypothetical protein